VVRLNTLNYRDIAACDGVRVPQNESTRDNKKQALTKKTAALQVTS
jgi:hypothetical protein